ncbi:YSC84-related protein [Terrimonas pollutisoli]|uniref:lipid-binding SYLF domain-containing protein n=1 Tax=Terrimonas pollutisoli TaxID=3034147 RepID=UPI0023ECC058|nr:YSC84-related protein [Terrimonas sp. H1YJ31]
MKKFKMLTVSTILLAVTALAIPAGLQAQEDKKDKLLADSKEAKEQFIKSDALMQNLFEKSYGYVIFPNVGKGAIGVGGAAGNGIVYEKGSAIGSAKMKQVSVGFQFGGQAYREVIFFENKAALDRFKENKFEFAAQVSAVAVTKGASANVKYKDGVMVFTQEKGGLMYEASIGGQKFDYTPF